MALTDNLYDGIKKIFLAGVGAVVIGAEKSQELVDELVRRGELTVEEGKNLNEELSRKVKETVEEGKSINEELARKVKEATDNAQDEVLRTKFRGMSAEERAAWIANAQKISDDMDAVDAEFETVVEEVAEAVEAEEAVAEVVEEAIEAEEEELEADDDEE